MEKKKPDPVKEYINELPKSLNLSKKLITSEFKNDYIKEVFRSLRSKIMMGLHDSSDKSIVITSLEATAGKSTISSNIGLSFAQQNSKVILIDGDMRKGVLHQIFDAVRKPGLSETLCSDQAITEETIHQLISTTHIPNCSLITCGEYTSNASELLSSPRFGQLKKILSGLFDLVIFDSPPIGLTIDAIAVSELFSKYIIVVKAGATNVIDLNRKINEYPSMSKKVLGLVLNMAHIDKKLSYYQYSKYYVKTE